MVFIWFYIFVFSFWLSIYNYPKDIQKISLPPKIKRTDTYTFLFLEERGLKCCRQTPYVEVRGLNWCEQTSFVDKTSDLNITNPLFLRYQSLHKPNSESFFYKIESCSVGRCLCFLNLVVTERLLGERRYHSDRFTRTDAFGWIFRNNFGWDDSS